jgi:hypothetical protein
MTIIRILSFPTKMIFTHLKALEPCFIEFAGLGMVNTGRADVVCRANHPLNEQHGDIVESDLSRQMTDIRLLEYQLCYCSSVLLLRQNHHDTRPQFPQFLGWLGRSFSGHAVSCRGPEGPVQLVQYIYPVTCCVLRMFDCFVHSHLHTRIPHR